MATPEKTTQPGERAANRRRPASPATADQSNAAGIAPPLSAAAMLDREFLLMRSRLLELAAALDRVDRAAQSQAADGAAATDPRLAQLREGLLIVAEPTADRAERLQLHFSLPYRETWQADFAAASG